MKEIDSARGHVGSSSVGVQCDVVFHVHVALLALGESDFDGPPTGIVDQVVHDGSSRKCLEVWIAFDIVGVEIVENRDVGAVIVDQRAFGVGAFPVG